MKTPILFKISCLKNQIAACLREIFKGVKKYVLDLFDLEVQLEKLEQQKQEQQKQQEQQEMKMTLEDAQKIVGDREAIKRGYVSEEIIDDAYFLASDLKNQPWFEPGKDIGQPYQHYLKSAVFAALDKKWKDSRRFAAVCKIASFVAK